MYTRLRRSAPALLLALALLAVGGQPAAAALPPERGGGGTSPAVAQAAAKPRVQLPPIPAAHYIRGMPHDFQGLNNCGPVSLNMVLGLYGIRHTERYTARKLKPLYPKRGVSILELVTFAQVEHGLGGLSERGGTMRLLEAYVSNGIPVIVSQRLRPDSDVGHIRVVRGYDREAGVVTMNDSLLGRNVRWSYDRFKALWDERGDGFAVIYPRSKQALAEAISRRHRESDVARQPRLMGAAREQLAESPDNVRAWLRLGARLYYSDRYGEALEAWERAKALGLPRRTLRYGAWPLGLMNEAGRHDEAVDMATEAIRQYPGTPAFYFERARAHRALGRPQRALRDLRLLLRIAPYHPTFREALAAHSP
jgi:tetratricopeptide (TPR) repeat protein